MIITNNINLKHKQIMVETFYTIGGSNEVVKYFNDTIQLLQKECNEEDVNLDLIAREYGINMTPSEDQVIGDYEFDKDLNKIKFISISDDGSDRDFFDLLKAKLQKIGHVTMSYIVIDPEYDVFVKHDEDNDYPNDECYVTGFIDGAEYFENDFFGTIENAIENWFDIMNRKRPKNKTNDELVDFINDYNNYKDDEFYYEIHRFEIE
jgi:hypothetical protein